MPPVATGIARCSAELVPALAGRHEIDVFVDQKNLALANGSRASGGAPLRSAYDFAWEHHKRPYDLVVYQLGNSSHHDYQWPYVFRYPGLAVLHDAHLHHARAACLLRTFRAADYRTEFVENHPDAHADLAELAIAGFDNHLHYAFPMTRLVALRSRRVAVHARASAERLRDEARGAAIESLRLGHGVELSDDESARRGRQARERYAITRDAIVFGCYGGLTRDKRVPQILAAFAATRVHEPRMHLLLAGAVPAQYDLAGDIARLGLEDSCTVTGYLETDDEFASAIAACDVSMNLRWPTAREISGPWLWCLAAGKPTVTIDLTHTAHVPSLDPRTWQSTATSADAPCTVAIDILDEDHSLRLAMRRLATDAALRGSLGRAALQYWRDNHSVAAMVSDYRRLVDDVLRDAHAPLDPAKLPDHLRDDGGGTLRRVMRSFDLPLPFPRRP
jgi:glycosyltransferase involved in cell wall biosynthesis